uniref:Serpin domain-containing protein n=1 Tax=Acrobeloides nanus TaxID=290746 RepID=A0A914DDB5_9BILA
MVCHLILIMHNARRVKLPCFKLETEVGLNETLKKMGLHEAFDETKADFSATCKVPLYISNVLQKAFIEANEEGTEADAATAMFERPRCCRMGPASKEFIANHPFLYLIVTKDGHILFCGAFYG